MSQTDLQTETPGPVPTPASAPEADATRLQSCFHLVGRVEDQLKFADSKAAFLATIHTLLVGPLVYNLAILRTAIWQWTLASRFVVLLLTVIYGGLFLASMALVALTVLPRFGRKGPRAASRMFFGQIAQEFGHDPRSFVTALASMTTNDWLEELGVYVVDASKIAAEKHRFVRRATVLTVASVVAWCMLVIAYLGLWQTTPNDLVP
ncbi:MAG: DUF5706 domain-containing protein [Isosphaeraceae bacterium]